MIILDDNMNNGDIHSFLFGYKTKPLKAINNIIDALKLSGVPFQLQPDEKIDFDTNDGSKHIILLIEGTGTICHSENELVLSTIFSPSVLGLIDGYSHYYDINIRLSHFFVAETSCSGFFVPLNKFVAKMDEQNLWHDIARILANRLMIMSIREKELVGVDSFLMVRMLLRELGSYSYEYRQQINVLSFIQRRTKISRSRILSILAELRKGEYISMEKGILVSINKKIPIHF